MKTAHLLAIVALGGAALSATCLSAGYALATANDSRSTEIIERELPWSGDRLVVSMPAVVRYVQTPGPARLVARGQHRSVSTLVIEGASIRDGLLHTGAQIELTLFAPDVSSFALDGASRLSIEAYDQPKLQLHLEGAAHIEAQGRAGAVSVNAQGGSTANLARLHTSDLTAIIAGRAVLTAAPSGNADIEAHNAAIAILTTEPAHLSARPENASRIIDASPGP